MFLESLNRESSSLLSDVPAMVANKPELAVITSTSGAKSSLLRLDMFIFI